MAMPQAFQHAGWINGWVFTVIIGFLLMTCLHIIINSQYSLCKKYRIPYLSYPDAMQKAFETGPRCFNTLAPISGYTVEIFLFIYQIGICGAYIVFVSTSVKQICDQYIDHIDLKFYMLIIAVPLIFLNQIPNLAKLAPLSALANLFILVSLILMFSFYIFNDLPPVSERNAFGEPLNFPLFVGTVMFSIESVGLILSVERTSRNPKEFIRIGGTLDQAMIILMVMYASVGFFGYLKYGEDILGSITMNIKGTTALPQVITILYATAIFMSYALQCYVPIEILWVNHLDGYLKDAEPKKRLQYAILLRFSLVILSRKYIFLYFFSTLFSI